MALEVVGSIPTARPNHLKSQVDFWEPCGGGRRRRRGNAVGDSGPAKGAPAALLPGHGRRGGGSASCATRTTPNLGFDAQTGEHRDLVKAGIIDPTKVVRTALQEAASVAGLLITTEAMIAQKPEPPPAAPPGEMGF